MIACKAFDPGLVCRGYQFHIGLNETSEANCAHNGFHCAANPLDCLSYYSNMDRAEYWLVDAGGDIDEDSVDSKISCTQLTILRRLTKKEFFLFALAYMSDHPLLPWNNRVQQGVGVAAGGFSVVRGPEPLAKGEKGDILALAKESADGKSIEQIGVSIVDGRSVRSNVWYDVGFIAQKSPRSGEEWKHENTLLWGRYAINGAGADELRERDGGNLPAFGCPDL